MGDEKKVKMRGLGVVIIAVFLGVINYSDWLNPTYPVVGDRQCSVLVTGCSRGGIGAWMGLRLKEKGFHVMAGYRKDADKATIEKLGFDPVRIDVSNETSYCRIRISAFRQTSLRFGKQ